MTSIIETIRSALERRKLRNEWARESGHKNYAAYLRAYADDADAGNDAKDGFNVWLAMRNGGRDE